MNRFEQLLEAVSYKFPNDWWLSLFNNAKNNLDIYELFAEKVEIYSKALECLDDESWDVLVKKAVVKFKADSNNRGKYQFFNLLNETFAYQFLIGIGMENVRFIKESSHSKTPDIKFCMNHAEFFCEVKTLGISDEEIQRYTEKNLFESSTYIDLGEGFFGKLSSNIDNALKQIGFASPHNIIYIIVNFDDFTGLYNAKYIDDIQRYIEKKYPLIQIYIQAGIENRFFIHTKPEITQ